MANQRLGDPLPKVHQWSETEMEDPKCSGNALHLGLGSPCTNVNFCLSSYRLSLWISFLLRYILLLCLLCVRCFGFVVSTSQVIG